MVRGLTVVGLAEGGAALLVEEPESGEQFVLSAEQLRIAAGVHRQHRTEAARKDQQRKDRENTMDPSLRPREIQERIRLGASPEEVAAAAGCDVSRIEKFAYPVLMERSDVAQRAQQAFPVVNGSAAKDTVARLAGSVLDARGQAASMSWDAYRTEAGWVLKLSWTAGHTENSARYSFSPSSSGGTVSPLDDAAMALVDPAPRPLRTVPEEVEPEPQPAVNPLVLQADPQPGSSPDPVAPTAADPRPEHRPAGSAGSAGSETAAGNAGNAGRSANKVSAALSQQSSRGGKPAMPSWEDVLPGARSSR